MNHADEHNRKILEEMVKRAQDAQAFETFKTTLFVVMLFVAAAILVYKYVH